MKTTKSIEFIRNKINSVEPQMRYDGKEDFKEWQKKSRAKLEELLGLPFEKCDDEFKIISEEQCDGYKSIEFEFQSEEGYYIPCTLLVPDEIKEPCAGVICLQGHSSGKHISLGIAKFESDERTIPSRDFALQAVKEGCCAIAMEQRYMGVAGQNENGAPSCIVMGEARPSLLLGRCAVGERVWDIQRLIDVIEKHLTQYIDKNKVMCLGNSGGGTATFYASCVDERIYVSVPSCAVCTYDASIVAMTHCECNYVPSIRKYFDMGDIGGLIAPRRFVQVNGIEDGIFPIEGAEKSFELIKEAYKQYGKEAFCRHVKGNGGHKFYAEEAWKVINELLEEND